MRVCVCGRVARLAGRWIGQLNGREAENDDVMRGASVRVHLDKSMTS